MSATPDTAPGITNAELRALARDCRDVLRELDRAKEMQI